MAASPGRTPGDRAAGEQAALRRVAVLVARATPPDELFAAVTEEAGRLLGVGHATMSQFDTDDAMRVVAAWSSTGAAVPIGTRMSLGGHNVHTLVFRTGRAARLDDYVGVSGPAANVANEFGFRGAVAAPVSVEGRLWGAITVASTREQLLPADTEARLAGFTELVAVAIANAQGRVELRSFAEEQAALRRVATLVASAATPETVFAAVTAEAGRVLTADVAVLARYDADGAQVTVGVWSSAGAPPVPVGTRTALGGRNVSTLVFQTGRSARIDGYADTSGAVGDIARAVGIRASVGVPISVAGRPWGVMLVATRCEPLPTDTEVRLAGFTELAATAIANAHVGTELREFAQEQAALRRVATLVARAAPPEEVFAAVTAETGRLLDADLTGMGRYDTDGGYTIVGTWASAGAVVPVGTRFGLGWRNTGSLVFQTGQPARIDDFGEATGPVAERARELGARAVVGVPVTVEGRLWGLVSVVSKREPLPADTEARLARFTELAATAIANAEAQAALTASRARIVAAADAARQRIERDLHDGAQQRLVSLALRLRATQAAAPTEASELVQQLEGMIAETNGVLEELREIARGLHPAVLADGGLHPALKALARRSAIPVRLDVRVEGRLPEPAELAAYYAVSEALTNTAKHARASVAEVEVAADQGMLRVCVRDDGRGGADSSRGSGLTGLRDRVEAIGGRISLHSPLGAGTALEIALPLDDPAGTVGLSPADAGS
jgi:signal transduction histidine kinase